MRKKISSTNLILTISLPIYLIGLLVAYYTIFDNADIIGLIILLYLSIWFFAMYCEFDYTIYTNNINGQEPRKDEGSRVLKLIFIFPIALLLHFAATIITFHKVLF